LKALSDAYRTDGKDADATRALERYVKLRPRDPDALLQIGSYYGNQGATIGGEWQDARAEASNQSPIFQPLGTAPTGQLGQSLTQDPIGQALNQRVDQLRQRSLAAFKKAETAFRGYAQLKKSDQFAQLQVADSARDAYILGGDKADRDVALFFYQRAIKLGPKTEEAKRAKEAIAALTLGFSP
jgi:tetratricopeptide (TPR) repeat protein